MQISKIATKTSIVRVTGLLLACLSATPAFGVDIIDDPVQIDERASQLLNSTNALCWEMHRFHQQESDFPESYRVAKGIWSMAGQLQDAARSGPIATEVLVQQVAEMNNSFNQLENSLTKWSSGDRSLIAATAAPVQRTIVRPGVQVSIPFVGIQVGAPPVVVTENGPPLLERRRFHPNASGSKRSLERQVFAMKTALEYLSEDVNITSSPTQLTLKPSLATPTPQPPAPDEVSGVPLKTSSEREPLPKTPSETQ